MIYLRYFSFSTDSFGVEKTNTFIRSRGSLENHTRFKWHRQYIGETKRQLNERFGEHRRSILNHHQLSNSTPVSLHFNQPGHSINDVHLIPLELMRCTRDTVRKAREAHLINKAKTLHPRGINRRDEARQ